MSLHFIHEFKDFRLIQLPVLSDNYSYILISDRVLVIDPGEAGPVLQLCRKLQIQPTDILNTHHHWDHTNGNLELQSAYNCKIWGPADEREKIPGLTNELSEGEFQIGKLKAKVISTPGHTMGHILLHFFNEKILFTGDVLFCGGCGRIFEGSFFNMFESLQKIKALPSETKIFCGHEYSLKNFSFAESVGVTNVSVKKEWTEKQNQGLPIVPTTLEIELSINPFLRARTVHEFRALRQLKDRF